MKYLTINTTKNTYRPKKWLFKVRDMEENGSIASNRQLLIELLRREEIRMFQAERMLSE